MAYRIQTNLIHNCNPGLLAFIVQLHHCRRDIGGRDDVGLGTDTRLDDQGVEGIGDQRDGYVDLFKGLVQRGGIVDIERNGRGVLEPSAELLGALKRAAGFTETQLAIGHHRPRFNRTNSDMDVGLAEDFDGGLGYLGQISWDQWLQLALNIPKPEPRRRTLEPAICLAITTIVYRGE